ncbi:hypothetical protein BGW80DRAFT_1307923 [Lactifluus volemus]|nr:hypothetical protein BGW80DRAFT_1307923 [Lactifluus volemus]
MLHTSMGSLICVSSFAAMGEMITEEECCLYFVRDRFPASYENVVNVITALPPHVSALFSIPLAALLTHLAIRHRSGRRVPGSIVASFRRGSVDAPLEELTRVGDWG